jgi:hypothetical protein
MRWVATLCAMWLGAAPAQGDSESGTVAFTGTLGGRNVIHMVLERSGERVRGSYFQVRVGKGIALEGMLDAGRLRLASFDRRERFEAVLRGKEWEGDWRHDGDRLALRLLATRPRPLPEWLRCEAQHFPRRGPVAVASLELRAGKQLHDFAIESSEPGNGRGCADRLEGAAEAITEPLVYGVRLRLREDRTQPRACTFELLRIGEFLLVRNSEPEGCRCGARARGHFAVLANVISQRCTIYDLR